MKNSRIVVIFTTTVGCLCIMLIETDFTRRILNPVLEAFPSNSPVQEALYQDDVVFQDLEHEKGYWINMKPGGKKKKYRNGKEKERLETKVPHADKTLFPWTKSRKIKTYEGGEEVDHDCSAPADSIIYSQPLKPGCRMEAISVTKALKQFHAKTLTSCDNTCPETDPLCNATTDKQWFKIDTKETPFNYEPFLKQGQYIYPWEKDYLSQPPLKDGNLLPSLDLSLVKIDSPWFAENSKLVGCYIGDVVTGRIYLKDNYGNQRTMGGDEVRVWISQSNSELSKGYTAAGKVQDLKNGTYRFSFRCLWPGQSKLNVAVPYPREFLRVFIQQNLAGVTRLQLGLFKKGDISEVTPCSAMPNVPGRPCICNMTFFQRFPFYCGRPKDSRLTCDDWSGARVLVHPQPLGVTDAEIQLINQATGPAQKNTIRHNITVFTANNTGKLPTLKPCNKLSASMTWNAKTPHGYFSPGLKWDSLQCRRPELTINFTRQCLQNTTVLFFGDSNSRKMFEALSAYSLCKLVDKNKWPNATICRNEEYDIDLSNYPHDYPLLYSIGFTNRPAYKDICSQLDAISVPSSRKYVIFIHYYLHYSYYHFSALAARIDAIKEALDRLLKRNPNVVVAIRGPHISTLSTDINHAVGGDSLAPFYKKFLEEKFDSLKNKVFFLDGWEMSVAIENDSFHPHPNVPKALILTLLSHYCP